MKKRLLSLVLAVLLIVSILPISALAAGGSTTYHKVDSFTDGRDYLLVIKQGSYYYAVTFDHIKCSLSQVTQVYPSGDNITLSESDVNKMAWTWNSGKLTHVGDGVKKLGTHSGGYLTADNPEYTNWTYTDSRLYSNGKSSDGSFWRLAKSSDSLNVTLASNRYSSGKADTVYIYEKLPETYELAYETFGGVIADDAVYTKAGDYSANTPIVTPAEDDVTYTGFKFDGWYLDSAYTTPIPASFTLPAADTTIYAKWVAEMDYTVEYYFENADGEFVKDEDETENPSGYEGDTVTATPEEFEGYTFDEDNEGNVLSDTLAATHETVLKLYYNINRYTVTWIDDNGTELEEDENVLYGAKPSYDGETPTKAPSAESTYTFAGWTTAADADTAIDEADLPAVTGDVTYKAKYTPTTRNYTVTWKSQDGTDPIETDEDIPYGSAPSFDAEAPTKAADAQYTYTFAGWATEANAEDGKAVNELPTVDGDEVYYAAFSKTVNTYTITWVDEDGKTVLETDEDVPYGATPSYDSETPDKEATAQYTYVFAGWTPNIEEVTGDATYKAVYRPTTNKYIVKYTDGVVGKTVFFDQISAVDYGAETPEFVGTPSRAGYTFKGWAPAVAEIVTKSVTYVAQWQRVVYTAPAPGVYVTGLNTTDHVAYIIGRGDDMFVPGDNVTRAEAATMFFRLMNDQTRTLYWDDECSYSDVKADAWYTVAIATLENMGAIDDTAFGGKFRPNDPITRAELAVMAAQFCTTTGTIPGTSFLDVTPAHWAYKEISIVQFADWIEGYNGKFRPDDNLTRAECVSIINRMLQRGAEAEDMIKDMASFKDNANTAMWYYEAVQEAANSHTYTRTGKVLTGEHFVAEKWTALKAAPDWAALEKAWAEAAKK